MTGASIPPLLDLAPVRGRGRTTVAARALDRVVSAVTADTFGVRAQAVHVDVSDRDGLLALHVRTPIRSVSLQRLTQTPGLLQSSRGNVIQRAADGQGLIRDRVTALTGAQIAHVTVELTGIEVRQERRVT